MGDGALVEFASAVGIVECAVAVQRAMKTAKPPPWGQAPRIRRRRHRLLKADQIHYHDSATEEVEGLEMIHFARAAWLVVLCLTAFTIFSIDVNAASVDPLAPIDTSSPRATLHGFVTTVDEVYVGMKNFLDEYEASGELYPTPAERRRQFEVLSNVPKAIKVLDLSDVAPVLRDSVGPARALQLKEILDRIEVPPPESIPDRDQVTHAPPSVGVFPEPRSTSP